MPSHELYRGGTKARESSKWASGSMSSSPTTGIWNKPRVFQERTNSPDVAIPTENSPHRLGAPEITITLVDPPSVIPIRAMSTPLVPISNVRRLQRYSLAEQDLAFKLQQSNVEPSPRELQIRALEKATGMLSAHAQDSRERADRLRSMLVDRSMDTKAYVQLKQERWMEERRQIAVDLHTKAVLNHLENLLDHPEQHSRVLATTGSSETTKEHRRKLNLTKFLQSSAAHPPVRVSKVPLVFPERTLRRRTLTRVSSMHLRAILPARASFGPIKQFRSNSLDGRKRESQSITDSKATGAFPEVPCPSPSIVAEDQDPNTDASSLSEQSSEYASESTHFHSPSTPPTHVAVFTPEIANPSDLVEPRSDFEKGGGTATIYRPRSPQFLAAVNTEEIEIQLPDYALDLFSRFDLNYEVPQPSLPPSSVTPSAPRPLSRFIPFPPSKPTTDQRKQPNRNSFPVMPSLTSPFSSPKKSAGTSSRLSTSSSHRNLRGLFVIPELRSAEKFGGSGFFSRPRGGHEDASASVTSLPRSMDTGEEKDGLPAKVRRRFSGLRLGRAQ